MVFCYFIGDTYYKTAVVDEYKADADFKDFKEKATGHLTFLQYFHPRQADLFPKSFLLHRPYNIIKFALFLMNNEPVMT